MNVKKNKQASFSCFTLIELLLNAACKTGVLYNRCGMLLSKGGALVRMGTDKYGNERRHAPQKTAFGVHHNACKASASCTDSALHICRWQMLHTAKPCFIQSKFTLIELLVSAACKTGVLYNRCGLLSLWGGALVRICTDKYGKVRREAPQKPAFWVHHNACKASASCTDSALHICRRQMLL